MSLAVSTSVSTPTRKWCYLRTETFRRWQRFAPGKCLRPNHIIRRGSSGGCRHRYRRVRGRACDWGKKGRTRGLRCELAGRNTKQASSCLHCHRIPRAENKLPRALCGYGYAPRRIPYLTMGVVGLWAHPRATGSRRGTLVLRGRMPGKSADVEAPSADTDTSTGEGGLGLPLEEARRMLASAGSRISTLPEVLADGRPFGRTTSEAGARLILTHQPARTEPAGDC